MSKKFVIFLIYILSVCCLKENPATIKINGLYHNKDTIGKKGTVVIQCSYDSSSVNIIDTTKTPFFSPKIVDNQGKEKNVNCGFWRKEQTSLYIFCNIDESVNVGEYTISFNETLSLKYKEYDITLEEPENEIKFKKVDKDMIDIYSDKQTINIEEGKDTYDFKFNMVSYNGETLILNYYFPLNCKKDNNILVCPMSKSKFEEFLSENCTEAYINYIDSEGEVHEFPLVNTIEIIYSKNQKKDINVTIKKLLTDNLQTNNHLAYETDVTDIPKVFSIEHFYLPFVTEDNVETQHECFFRKYENKPLYIVCLIKQEGTYHLKKITTEIKVDNLNVKYNFIIQKVEIDEKVKYEGEGSMIYFIYPDVLDFTSQNSFSIILYAGSPDDINGITFNEDKENLQCVKLGDYFKKCEVPKEHFEGKENDYYFTKHDINSQNKSISYEVPPVKVILTKSSSKGNYISFSLFYSLVLLLIMS